MFFLTLSLQAWKTDNFIAVLTEEICSLEADNLPLQQGLQYSSYANAENLSATILSVTEQKDKILVKAGLFYTGIIAGCNCADDPTPVDEINEYCEILLCIDKKTAQTTVLLIE